MTATKRVTAALVLREGCILVARRRPGIRLAGKWEFPGGKIEPGETPEECLARELREELEIEVRVGAFVASSTFAYGFGTIELLGYEVELVSGELKLKDHDAVQWVPVGELLGVDLAEADVPIARALVERGR